MTMHPSDGISFGSLDQKIFGFLWVEEEGNLKFHIMKKKVCDLQKGDLVKTLNGKEKILTTEFCMDDSRITIIVTKSGKYEAFSKHLIQIFN